MHNLCETQSVSAELKMNEEGLLLIARAPVGDGPFLMEAYKPCPSCFLWVADLAKHRSQSTRCINGSIKMSKRQASFIACTLVINQNEASKDLQMEVLAKLKDDAVNNIIKNYPLLIKFGNTMIKENYKNTLKRDKYT